jgi:hypothetical protein
MLSCLLVVGLLLTLSSLSFFFQDKREAAKWDKGIEHICLNCASQFPSVCSSKMMHRNPSQQLYQLIKLLIYSCVYISVSYVVSSLPHSLLVAAGSPFLFSFKGAHHTCCIKRDHSCYKGCGHPINATRTLDYSPENADGSTNLAWHHC